MSISRNALTFQSQPIDEVPEAYSTIGWSAELRNEYLTQWQASHLKGEPLSTHLDEAELSFTLPAGYSDVVDHEARFFESVRSRKTPVENEVFGNHAAILLPHGQLRILQPHSGAMG